MHSSHVRERGDDRRGYRGGMVALATTGGLMSEVINFQRELAEAEVALLKAEETYGKDHVQVSYCLDRIVRLLRSNNVRLLDATNMEARARAIRVKHNQDAMANVSSKMQDISDAVLTAAYRKQKERSRQMFVTLGVLLLVAVGIYSVVLVPTPQMQQARDALVKAGQGLNPSAFVNNFAEQATSKARQAAAQQAKRTSEVNNLLDQN